MASRTVTLLALLLLVPSIIAQTLSKPTTSGLSTSSVSSNKPLAAKPSSFNFFPFGSSGASAESQSLNPYPIRTMIGNLYFRLRQHKTPIMIIPPLLRIVYQYRRPIIGGLSSAFQALSASPVASGAGEVLSKGSAAAAASGGLASAASQAVPALAGSSYPLFNMAPGYGSLLPALGTAAAGGAAFPYAPLTFA